MVVTGIFPCIYVYKSKVVSFSFDFEAKSIQAVLDTSRTTSLRLAHWHIPQLHCPSTPKTNCSYKIFHILNPIPESFHFINLPPIYQNTNIRLLLRSVLIHMFTASPGNFATDVVRFSWFQSFRTWNCKMISKNGKLHCVQRWKINLRMDH